MVIRGCVPTEGLTCGRPWGRGHGRLMPTLGAVRSSQRPGEEARSCGFTCFRISREPQLRYVRAWVSLISAIFQLVSLCADPRTFARRYVHNCGVARDIPANASRWSKLE